MDVYGSSRSVSYAGETNLSEPRAWSGPPAGSRPRMIVADPDPESRAVLASAFQDQGFETLMAADGDGLDTLLESGPCALVVLDQVLPGEGGLAVCRRLNRDHPELPLMFFSSRGDEMDRIIALELGADDYVLKPCSPREFVARARAVLRRRAPPAEPAPVAPPPAREPLGCWALDTTLAAVRPPRGGEVRLAAAELTLLEAMIERPRTLMSRDELLELTRGSAEVPYPRIVDITISRLRRKIERVAPGEELIRTVRGRGYVLVGEISRRERRDGGAEARSAA